MKVSVTKGLMQIIPPHVARFGEHYLPELDFLRKLMRQACWVPYRISAPRSVSYSSPAKPAEPPMVCDPFL